jgi:hypothetical protein
MGTIGSNAAPSAMPFATGASNGAGSTNSSSFTEKAANDADKAKKSPDAFMRLVKGMIQGNTSSDELPSNLVEFLLTGDGSALEGVDTDDTDSEDGDEAEGLAALLAGLQAFNPLAGAGAGSGGGDGVGSIDGSERRGAGAAQALLGMLGSQGLAGAQGGPGSVGAFGEMGALGLGADGSAAGSLDGTEAALMAALDEAAAAAGGADGSGAPAQPSNSASPMQHLLQAHRAAEGAPQAASAEVRTPVGAPGWNDEIGTHLTMMAANGREAASLRLSPEHLGPLEIRISMKDGETSVVFGASNPDTRSALEQSLPRLREMFASQGLVLGDANVSRDAPRDSFRPATFSNARGSSDAGLDTDVKPVTLSRLGLVDTYV